MPVGPVALGGPARPIPVLHRQACPSVRWEMGKTGPNPTDRGQPRSKHHVTTEAQGSPWAARFQPVPSGVASMPDPALDRASGTAHGSRPGRGPVDGGTHPGLVAPVSAPTRALRTPRGHPCRLQRCPGLHPPTVSTQSLRLQHQAAATWSKTWAHVSSRRSWPSRNTGSSRLRSVSCS